MVNYAERRMNKLPTLPMFLLLFYMLISPGQVIPMEINQQPFVLEEQIPILMYHEIGIPSGPWKELYVKPETFARQLDWIKANGYSTVQLKDVYNHWYKKFPLPEKPIVITFDDGYRNMYDKVLPLLVERKMKATFFLYPRKFNTPNGLTKDMVVSLAEKGMEIGSHTLNHLDLTKISGTKLQQELLGSKLLLEKMINKPVNFICYPSGRFNDQIINEVRKYGYLGAVTTQMGKASINQNPFQWKRIRINFSDGVNGFIKKISN